MAGEPSTNQRLHRAWISPSVAVERICRRDLHFETAARTIGERLRAGLISAIAAVSTDPLLSNPRRFVTVGPDIWRHWAPLQDYDFWRTGDIEISKAGITGYGDETHLATLFWVRFCPEDIDQILPALGLPQGTTESAVEPQSEDVAGQEAQAKSTLSEADLNEWANLFNKVNPTASEATARKALEAMFPNHHVTRTRLRRVLPERKAGRPLKDKEQ